MMKRAKRFFCRILVFCIVMSITVCNTVAVASSNNGSDVESLYINDTTVMEYTDGFWFNDGSYIYSDFHPDYTVKLKDGREFKSDKNEISIDGKEYILYFDEVENNGRWTRGNTYKVTGKLSGTEAYCVFNVTVVYGAVESLDINDTTIVENTWGLSGESIGYISDFYPDFKVKMRDGREFNAEFDKDRFGVCIDGDWCELFIAALGVEEDLTVGNTYKLTGMLKLPEGNYACSTFNVAGIKNPVENIIIEDTSVIEGTHGYDYEGNYIYNEFHPNFTVRMKDGRNFSVENGENNIKIDGSWHSLRFTRKDLDYWQLGGTYNVVGVLSGCNASDEFNVTVVGNPVESITVNDITVTENNCGYINRDGNYIYNDFYPEFTVLMKDGTRFTCEEYSFGVDIKGRRYSLSFKEIENNGFWKAGNTYKVTAELEEFGVSAAFNVTVLESQIESFIVNDVTIAENTCGHFDDDGNYIYDNIVSGITVKMKDGREFSGNSGAFIDGKWCVFEITELENGGLWQVGNTYKVIGRLKEYGIVAAFRVTIKASPVAKIEVPDVSVIENTHGYETNGHYIYDDIRPDFTMTMKDGSVIQTYVGRAMIDSVCYELTVFTEQNDVAGYWTAGNTYKARAKFGGSECDFNITVIKNPVRSLEIENETIYEHEMNIDKSGVPRYVSKNLENGYLKNYSVTLNDGSTIKSEEPKWPAKINSDSNMLDGIYARYLIYIGGLGYSIDAYEDDQSENPWGVGEHTVTASFLSVEGTYTVTVKESIIKSLEAEDTVLIDRIDIRDNNGELVFLDDVPYRYTVTLKDGTHKSLLLNEKLEIEGCNLSFRIITPSDSLVPGETYELTGALGHLKCKFRAEIVESPVKNIEIVKLPDKTEYVVDEQFDLKGTIIRMNYNDNTYEDIVLTQEITLDHGYGEARCYSERLKRYKYMYFSCDFPVSVGNNTIGIYFLDKYSECHVKVKGKGVSGDLNDDGKVTAVDALIVLQMVVGKNKLDDDKKTLADVNKSGEVTASDALLILQLAVGKIKDFG